MYHAYAAGQAGQPLEPTTYEPPPLGPFDVEVRITHCGICHSDVHILDGDWGSHFPAIAGHEIVGMVTQKGDLVRGLDVGQRVGVGWQCGSCMDCEWCVRGDTNLCPDSVATCRGRPGGFADHIRVDGRFAYAIPDVLDSVNAAPLLCGGITVYAPMRRLGMTAATRVGVIGIGGLGHLALQFASRFGCEVTAFSSSPDKAAEARGFGATAFVNSRDDAALKSVRGSLDLIICTVNVNLNWGRYLQALRPEGTLVLLGAIPEAMDIRSGMLVSGQKTITGGVIGNRAAMREMLDFAARTGIAAQTETLPMASVNAGLDRVRSNQARYRVVLVNEA
ncbi:MAG: NAD(P)-dependent alcohol dehydrogenase [Chloroflexota bacterium]